MLDGQLLGNSSCFTVVEGFTDVGMGFEMDWIVLGRRRKRRRILDDLKERKLA